MGWVSGIAVFVITWWVILFAVLPWGATPPDQPEEGMADSAPARPRMLMKFAVTTGISVLVWLAIYGVVASDLISFRDMARHM
ncbi:DUF1467 family protein [Azospirillum sp. RWY-5-1]|uniref:DUF1467 family protein n=1 Tax=Azospirillum oleiclasticum TaxID=2735135 RepID=A0ABX2T4X1_9PROT|nr:DUF1467 family protein [Azospirillum oleiclasticum]NYZ12222.1 DUF1467 family protein [Azospirillum oleiclasticum]NYZ19382.1 DUF1467 family protein [Azospirillum oleiclasticum]